MQAQARRRLAIAVVAILVLALVSVTAMAWLRGRAAPVPVPVPTPAIAPPAATANAAATTIVTSAHYRIASSADPAQTARTAAAVEALYVAWRHFFTDPAGDRDATTPVATTAPPLQLRLYRDRGEFKANNRSQPWAEAYYLAPVCHAYLDVDADNPTHWMLHEAVHQLNREVGHVAAAPWQNEGLATYFAASPLRDGVVQTGAMDLGAYPLWWLAHMPLTGDLDADIAAGRIVPLRKLIDGSGPPVADDVNRQYLHWWSLTHFLLHGAGGRHATAYRRLLAGDGSLAQFEREFADVDALQADWYAYLLARIAEARAGGDR